MTRRHPSRTSRRLAAFLVSHLFTTVLCAVPCAAADAGPELPTRALRTYYTEERALGAERSEALGAALLQLARQAPTAERRLELLELAARMDSNRADPHLQRAEQLLRQRDLGGAVEALRDGWQVACGDALERARWLRKGQRAARWILLITLCVGALSLSLRTLPLLRHRLGVRRAHGLPLTVMVVSPFVGVSLAAPALAALTTAVALTPFLRRSERAAMAVLVCLLAGTELWLDRMGADAVLLDRSSTSAVLAHANHSRVDPQAVGILEKTLSASPERDLVLGLQATRARDWETAYQRYMAAANADPKSPAAFVDLANLFYATGDYQRAASGYRTALSLPPTMPFAHANLAQTYIAMLRFDLADEEMAAATALGFDALAAGRRAWQRYEAPIFDVLLDAASLRYVAATEAAVRPDRVEALLNAWRGAGWTGLPRPLAPWVLLGAAAVLVLPWRVKRWARRCSGCGRVCCSHCLVDAAVSVCPSCAAQATPKFGAVPRRRHRRTADEAPDWALSSIAALFPGAAQLAVGSVFLGLMTALVASTAVLGIADAAAGLSSDLTNWAVDGPQSVQLALLVFGFAYIPGLLQMRAHLARRGA